MSKFIGYLAVSWLTLVLVAASVTVGGYAVMLLWGIGAVVHFCF